MNIAIIGTAIVLNLLLLIGLLVIVPRLLRRHDSHASEDALRLREMLLDVLSEQEAVTLRQNQIGISLATMNQELNKLATTEPPTISPEALAQAAGLPQLERRLEALQGQLGGYYDQTQQTQHIERVTEAQNWGNLMSLLATMQDRIAVLNGEVAQQNQPRYAADRLLEELEAEMQHLRELADDIAGLQLNLRRSVLERETHLANLRSELRKRPALSNRAA